MCATCVATGAAYAVPGLVALRVWAKRRPDPAGDDVEAAEPEPVA